jgi:phosphoglycolate phosphatase
LPKFSPAEIKRLRRMPPLKARKELGIPLSRVPRLLIKGRQAMHDRIHEVQPFSSIPDVLQQLHKTGYHLLVMSSNSERNVRTFLRANHLESCFDGVYGGVGVFDKAGALRKVMRRNHLERDQCMYVGDEVRDAVAAQKVGIRIISVGWGYQAPSALAGLHPLALLKQPVELLELLESGKV